MYVNTLRTEQGENVEHCRWDCCESIFSSLRDVHKHVSLKHRAEVEAIKTSLLRSVKLDDKDCSERPAKKLHLDASACSEHLPARFSEDDEYEWLPRCDSSQILCADDKPGRVLLFYHYRRIADTGHVRSWQEALCTRLHLTGKVRIAAEGLNVTVAGSQRATELYMHAVLSHPLFTRMTRQDFKTSPGSAADFERLKVGVYAEVCPMGVDPQTVSYANAGKHVTPEEFHEAVSNHVTGSDADILFVDCRNFYESKIGAFSGAVRPDIRKFSYWPEYVDKNTELFRDKTVYMYCTGGIRCERGSAYLRDKGLCKDVLQLSGGIHKYMERYPDGHFRGKLFVFDNRYHIAANADVIARCTYCGEPWDQYQRCTSAHCHQLVLSCTRCRARDLTACCRLCQQHVNEGRRREECECTRARDRIPVETLGQPDIVPSHQAASHGNKTASHCNETASHCNESGGHCNEYSSNSSEAASHGNETASHCNETVSHGNEGASQSNEGAIGKSHGKESANYGNENTSHCNKGSNDNNVVNNPTEQDTPETRSDIRVNLQIKTS